MPAPTSTSVPARLSCASAASWPRPLPEHSSATSNGSSTRSCGHCGVSSSSGSTVRAPSFSHSSRRVSFGSLTTMSSTPSALSAATERKPIGPPPVTSQRVPGRAPPPWVMPCSATASGSTSAACLSERWSGTRSASAARDDLVAGERALPVAVVGADPAPARAQRHPAGEAVLALAALGRLARDDPVADRSSRSRRRRRRRRCPRTRGPRSRWSGRPTRRGSAGRSRRPRSG